MRSLKVILSLILVLSLAFCFAGCKGKGKTKEETTQNTTAYVDYNRENKAKVALLEGHNHLGAYKVKKDRDYAYETTVYKNAQEITELLENSQVDFATLPVDKAVEFCAGSDEYKIIATTTLATTQVIDCNSSLENIKDLSGKTIYSIGEGSVEAKIFEKMLSDLNIRAKMVYKESREEVINLAKEGKAELLALSEPFCVEAMQCSEKAVSVDINEYYFAQTGNYLTQNCVLGRKTYIEENPEETVEFLGFLEVSVNYMSAQIEAASNEIYEDKVYEDRGNAPGMLTRCAFKYLGGEQMVASVKATAKALGLPELSDENFMK